MPARTKEFDAVAGPAHEQLGGGADQAGAGEGVAGGEAFGETAEQHAGVDGPVGGRPIR